MSSPQDSETKRAALDKAQEGRGLLRAGDYQGAIAACTEAIELDSRILGAYGSRAEAYRRLGMEKEAAVDLSDLAHLRPSNDLQSVIVIKSWLKLVGGWVMLVCGCVGLLVTLVVIGDEPGVVRDPGFMDMMGGINAFMFLFAIWLLGSTTKITLLPGYIVVSRGHIPLFLWFLRTKYISTDEAKSAFVDTEPWETEASRGETYLVRVVRESGKSVTLHEDQDYDVAHHLVQRIREFGLVGRSLIVGKMSLRGC